MTQTTDFLPSCSWSAPELPEEPKRVWEGQMSSPSQITMAASQLPQAWTHSPAPFILTYSRTQIVILLASRSRFYVHLWIPGRISFSFWHSSEMCDNQRWEMTLGLCNLSKMKKGVPVEAQHSFLPPCSAYVNRMNDSLVWSPLVFAPPAHPWKYKCVLVSVSIAYFLLDIKLCDLHSWRAGFYANFLASLILLWFRPKTKGNPAGSTRFLSIDRKWTINTWGRTIKCWNAWRNLGMWEWGKWSQMSYQKHKM